MKKLMLITIALLAWSASYATSTTDSVAPTNDAQATSTSGDHACPCKQKNTTDGQTPEAPAASH